MRPAFPAIEALTSLLLHTGSDSPSCKIVQIAKPDSINIHRLQDSQSIQTGWRDGILDKHCIFK